MAMAGETGLARGQAAAGAKPAKANRCLRAVVEGEVRAGEGFRRSFGGGLDFALEPIASGWVIRVLPTVGRRPAEDYAELATPPYRSVSPLLLSTDFSFRAQDAVGWNPRRFRFAASAAAFARLEGMYRRVTEGKGAPAGEEGRLAELASEQPEGVLEIVDAGLVAGTADQTAAAGLVSTHFGTTAHRMEQPSGGRPTALGRIAMVRFRARLELGGGMRTPPGVLFERYTCSARPGL